MGAVMVRVSIESRVNGEVSWVEVAGQLVAEHFAVHPAIEVTPEMRTVLAGDYFGVTHLPTGLNVLSSPYMEAAIAGAKELAALPIDWATIRKEDVALLPQELRDRARAIRLGALCDDDRDDEAATLTKQEAP